MIVLMNNLLTRILIVGVSVALIPSNLLTAEAGWVEGLVSELDDPIAGLLSNVGVDIVAHRGGVWVGTLEGVSFTNDLGQTWFTYDKTTGLNANITSALFASGDRIWVAAASSAEVGGILTSAGNGIQFSDNGGFNWQDPEDISGLLRDRTFGPVKVTFDIAAFQSNIFAASFVGGLIGSQDKGVTWKNFHATNEDSVWFAGPQNTAPPFTSRYFSVTIDTSRIDTMHVFAGNAGGITQLTFLKGSESPGVLSHESVKLETVFLHTFENSGLPGNFVPALAIQYRPGVGPIVWAAARPADSLGRDRTGVARNDLSRGLVFPSDLWVGSPGLPDLVWNFGFNGDTILAATDEGLYLSLHPDSSFARVDFLTADTTPVIPSTTSVRGVAVIGEHLWVTTVEGIFRTGLDSLFFDIVTDVSDEYESHLPQDFVLHQNFPNPFNPRTTIHFDLSRSAKWEITIYNLSGQVAKRFSGHSPAGSVSVEWDASSVSSGVYFFNVRAGKNSATKKMILLK